MEYLREFVIDKSESQQHLNIYVSGGGVMQSFRSGEPCEETIYKLRFLADLLEHSLAERPAGLQDILGLIRLRFN